MFIHVPKKLQTIHVLLEKGGIKRHLKQIEVMACIVAALVLQHTATRCITLQLSATHCNTLQYTLQYTTP